MGRILDEAGARSLAAIHAITIFLSAFLLFQVEPIAAKYILPWFGGGPEVWTTCLLFFQVLLLAGYAYAHWLQSSLSSQRQAAVHIAIVIACVATMAILACIWRAPILPGAGWKPADPNYPVVRILVLLTVAVGLPYLVLSATGPLLQAWFARIKGASPYRLYALSNLGSLIALLSYPFVVEPWLPLRSQALIWSFLYAVFAVGIGLCAAALSRHAPDKPMPREDGAYVPSPGRYALWIALAACPSLMLLATTNEITREVAPVPFLWVVPLALYLLSFVLCFDSDRWYRRGIFYPALFALIAAASYAQLHGQRIVVQSVVYSALLFTSCMVGHGELARTRPAARHLTAFYIAVAIGGAVGGTIAAVIAPLLFRGFWEFQFAVWLSAALAVAVLMRDPESWIHESHPVLACTLFGGSLLLPQALGIVAAGVRPAYDLAVAGAAGIFIAVAVLRSRRANARPGTLIQIGAIEGLVSLAAVSIALIHAAGHGAVLSTRNFYGPLTVFVRYEKDPEWRYFELRNGHIIHGAQYSSPRHRRDPTTYYSPLSGIGLLLQFHPRRDSPEPGSRALRIGMVGLGAGTVAVYGQPRDYIRYYEINPAVIELAAGATPRFTFIRDSRAHIDIVPGDGRIAMEREVAERRAQNFDVLGIDAFSGDSIPVHLLTREAFQVYLSEIAPGGVIAFHITNGYLDLKPVVKALADSAGMESGWIHYPGHPPDGEESDWVLIARDPGVLARPAIETHVDPMKGVLRLAPWTDDYSSLFSILK